MSKQDLEVIVVGAGRVGAEAVHLLDDYGASIHVIEQDEVACDRLSDRFEAVITTGDAVQPSTFRQANPASADVVAALTGNTGTNIGVCAIAKQFAPDSRTVLRIGAKNSSEYTALPFVDDVVFPENLGARAAVNAILGADVRAIEELTGNLNLLELTVHPDAPIAGKRLESVTLPHGSLVVSDAEQDEIPASDMRLAADRSYIIAAEPEVTEEITQLFRG